MSNILSAISNIIANPVVELKDFYFGRNRANNMGEALESYVKDAFADTFHEADEGKRLERFERVFSYTGNKNNPPDAMIRSGDAIEVKKIESHGSQLALNSSHPKAKLYANSDMITNACRDCEEWVEKDMIYTVGVVNGNQLKKLFFVYGVDYAASGEIYQRIKNTISDGLHMIPNVELAETNEIGRVNRVDPLGITDLRVRGMWGIENPSKVFSYIYTPQVCDFELVAIINDEKYYSFSDDERMNFQMLISTNYNFKDELYHKCEMKDVKIKTPDNPSVLKTAKLIMFRRYKENIK